MPLEKTQAILLHRIPYSETSLILKAYTRENGLTGLIAKGARRPKSRFNGLSNSFSIFELIYRRKPNAGLFVLQEAGTIKSFRDTMQNLNKQVLSNLLLEIYLRLLYGPEASIPLYELLRSSLENIDSHLGAPIRFPLLLCDFLLQFNAVTGVRPQFNRCSKCGSGPGIPFPAFALDMGGPLCNACFPQSRNAVKLRPSLFRWLAKVSENGVHAGTLPLGEMLNAERLLLDFSRHHSSRSSVIRSYNFYSELIKETLVKNA